MNVYRVIKRLFDITVAVVLLVLFIPVFIAIATAVWLDSGSPVLFRQLRVGQGSKPFWIYKFRTMLLNQNASAAFCPDWPDGVPENFVFKSAGDARVTRVGRLLRKLSLDEIPQLINVVIGSMSLVGPRPEIPEIARHYNHEQVRRLQVRPGITGLAQVSGRGELMHGDKIRLDLKYIEDASMWCDLTILWRTLMQVVAARGAW